MQTVAKSWQPNKNKGFKYLDPSNMYLKMRSMIHISLCVFPSFLGLSLSHHLMIHSSAEWGEDLTQKYKGLKFRNKNTQPWDLSHVQNLNLKTFQKKNYQNSKSRMFLFSKNNIHLTNTLLNLFTFYFIKPINFDTEIRPFCWICILSI